MKHKPSHVPVWSAVGAPAKVGEENKELPCFHDVPKVILRVRSEHCQSDGSTCLKFIHRTEKLGLFYAMKAQKSRSCRSANNLKISLHEG